MALKDWRKTGKSTWRNDVNWVIVSKHSNKEVGWIFSSGTNRRTNPARTFKTKSQALRSARSYMRKN